MTGSGVFIFFLVIAIGCEPYIVQGFVCRTAQTPVIITADTIPTVNFTWDCKLMLNESILSMVWLKEDICIGKVSYGTFTPCESYKGRVELFETYGISINNVSRKDSGHYNVVILLKGNHDEYKPCNPIYFPVLPEHSPVFKNRTALPFSNVEQPSKCELHGPSNLEIGLICGILTLTVCIGLCGVVWYFQRKIHKANHIEKSPELSPLSVTV